MAAASEAVAKSGDEISSQNEPKKNWAEPMPFCTAKNPLSPLVLMGVPPEAAVLAAAKSAGRGVAIATSIRDPDDSLSHPQVCPDFEAMVAGIVPAFGEYAVSATKFGLYA
jgi:hypothetical protein